MEPEVLEVISNRANHGIDPHMHIWGWEIPGYLFLGGVVAGIMVLLALLELTRKKAPSSLALKVMPLVGAGLLSVGMFFLFLDLANPWNVLRFYGAFHMASPMSWGSWLLILVYPVLILMTAGALTDAQQAWVKERCLMDLGRTVMGKLFAIAKAVRPQVLWMALILGAGLGVYTGLLLGASVARPLWNTSVLGPLFLVSGVSTGAAFMMLMSLDKEEAHTLAVWDTIAIVVELLLIVALVINYLTGPSIVREAGHMLLGGGYTASFWGLVVVAGLLAPLALNAVELKKHVPATRFAPILILIGGFTLRWVMVMAGQLTSYSHIG